VDAPGNSPRRRYYKLTQSGEHALATGLDDWHRFKLAADAVLGQ
jgi:DNA-binding PadR family transcriptional regulator